MSGEEIIGILLVFIALIVLVYLISALGLYLYLRKIDDSNKWGAFIPIYNSYKYFKIVYDGLKIDKVSAETDLVDYREKRRTKALVYFLVYIGISFVLGFVVGMYEIATSPETLEYSANVEYQTTGNILLDVVTIILSIILVVFVTNGVNNSMYNKETMQGLSKGAKVINVILTIITFGSYSLILMYFFGISSKYGYKLDGNYLKKDELVSDNTETNTEDRFNLTHDKELNQGEEEK